MPLWHAALNNQYEIAELLLDRGADSNASVYASGWPLMNPWSHPDGKLKNLLLARGAKRQPYMVSQTHDIAEAKQLLDNDPSEHLASELTWSAADHGCPAIVELALLRLQWPSSDPRWHRILIQPIRRAITEDEGHFHAMAVLRRHGIDANVSRYGQTALPFRSRLPG